MHASLRFLTIADLRALLKAKKISPQEIAIETCKLFKSYDSDIKSALEVFEPASLDYSKASNFTSALSGIPYLVKDVICQKGRITACASKMLENYTAPYDAHVIEMLSQAGALSCGRANCDEFAMGSSTETSAFQKTYNPWDYTRVPGGSSGGSAAAVAAGLVPFSLGTETGGSVRQPAILCGVVGLKPTYGLFSRYGVVAYASSLDQVGILARTVEDVATVSETLAVHDKRDSTSRSPEHGYKYVSHLATASCKDKKIAYIENAINAAGVDPEVRAKFFESLKVFEQLGAEITPITMRTMEYSSALYFIISRAEAASNLSRFDGVKYGYRSDHASTLSDMYAYTRREGFGENVRRRILIGSYVLSAGYEDEYYNKAKHVQELMRAEFTHVLAEYDALASPVSPNVAFKIGEVNTNSIEIDLQDYFTASANLTGLPALGLPGGFVRGLPTGFQLIGSAFDEKTLFELGHVYQQHTNWHMHKPQSNLC